MNANEIHEAIKALAPAFVAYLRRMEPEDAERFIGGMLANMVGPMPEEYWRRVKAKSVVPCDSPGCTCERFRAPIFEALEALRLDWIEVSKNRRPFGKS